MNAEELIQSLIDDLKALTYPNERSLTRLLMRSKMIIRRVFGDSSKYLEELEVISFPPVPSLMEGSMVALNLQRAQNWDSAKLEMLALFESMQEDLQLSDITKTVGVSKPELKLSNRIFVVHGHDGEMKESVARMLQKLGLDPIILHEKASTGRTIIEKIERNSDVGFAVVLLSPDDKGCTKSEFSGGARPRARQNVIFEMGYFIGKLGRNCVAAILRGEDTEKPSDIDGIVYIPYDSSEWKSSLAMELKACGYDIDMNKLY